MRIQALALCLLALALPARAQSVTITDLSATFGPIGTAPSLVVPAVGDSRVPFERTTLFLMNGAASGGNTISCGYSAAITVNGNGTFTIPAGQSMFWSRGNAPRNAIWCVASGAGTPMQIAVGN